MAAGTRLLVTKDNGVEAEGLHHLAAYARDLGMRVLVAALRHDTSGRGTSQVGHMVRTGAHARRGMSLGRNG